MAFMTEDIVEVDPKTETISCDGGEDGLGHPAVYYTFNNENKIVCGYCCLLYTSDAADDW